MIQVALALLLSAAPDSALIVKQGQRLYATGDYVAAERLLNQGLAAGLAPTDGLTARLYVAASQFGRGDRTAARETMRLLLVEKPDFEVALHQFPPPFLEIVEDVRREATAAPPLPVRPVEPPRTVAAPDLTSPPPLPPTPRRWSWVIPGVAAGVAAIAGVSLLFVAQGQHLTLTTPGPALDATSAERAVQLGQTTQATGWGLLGGAVLGALISVGLAIFDHGGTE